MRHFVYVLAVLGASLAACGSAPHSSLGNLSESTCPGSPPLHCLTSPECSFDMSRQCNMCRCSPAIPQPAQGPVNSESIPPIH